MLVLVSYDVPDDRRRLRLARLLSAVGDRVQLSVFEAHLDEPGLARLRARVRAVIEPAADSVRFYRLGERYRARVSVEGLGRVTPELDYVVS